jgi:ribosomal protein S20
MPVTKTAKRALRSSKRKRLVNIATKANLEIAIRAAKKKKDIKSVNKAVSLADRAAKKKFIHKNKVAHIKSSLSKILPISTKKPGKSKKTKSK